MNWLQKKAVSVLGLEGWISRNDGDNFRTNTITVAEYNDRSAASAGAAMGLAAVWACVNLLAGTIASLPLMVYRDVNGQREVAKDHPLYRLLHDSPNFDQTALDFWEFVQGSIELYGNAYAEKAMTGSGRITALTPIRADLVAVKRLRDGSLEYSWTENGIRSVASQDRILHIRGAGGGPLGGASTLSVCRSTFASAVSVDRASRGVFNNGARPSGVLTKEGQPFVGDQRKVAEQLLQEKYVGAMNDGRPMLLDNGLKWQQLSINPDDAQMLESRSFSVEEIARVFGVPPHMIGHTEKSTSWGTGIEQQTLGFVKFTLRRRLERIEQALEKQLLTAQDRAAGVTIEFNLEGLLRGDSANRATFYKEMTGIGVMTINECRALENLPPVEGGEVPRMQMQNVPITYEAPAPAPVDPAPGV